MRPYGNCIDCDIKVGTWSEKVNDFICIQCAPKRKITKLWHNKNCFFEKYKNIEAYKKEEKRMIKAIKQADKEFERLCKTLTQ